MMRSYFWLSRFAVWLFAMMTVAPLGGCGYQFVGESSLLPKEARTIYVEPFVNRSRDVISILQRQDDQRHQHR